MQNRIKNFQKSLLVACASFLPVVAFASSVQERGAATQVRSSVYTSLTGDACEILDSVGDGYMKQKCSGFKDASGRGFDVILESDDYGTEVSLTSPDSQGFLLNMSSVSEGYLVEVKGAKMEWRGRVNKEGRVVPESIIFRVVFRTERNTISDERLVVFKINPFRACLVAAVPANDPRGGNRLARQIADVVAPGTPCSPDFSE